ncbi:unnamed protein product [Tenebrio molitor]|nr:unnamed protein product [Tenebrio molitor]
MTTREVVLDGGSPWGFRLHGGADLNQPLRISRVNPGSKAALRGIREGDFITSINNQSTKDISNAEAHALLRNSGDTLKLGLNEDTNGSPKRRQYKTVHQETHSETVKKSSVTSYTITSKSNTLVSQKSTLSSTCSSSSSTPSTYTSPSEEPLSMADNGARSRRRRARNQRRKAKNTHATIYRVDSPKTLPKKQPVKSRSLDDDDIKIQELSEVSESEDKECKAIVSEAESDYTTEPVSLISPEEELNLRNFLEGLNLVNSPEDAFRACEASTMESVKSRRARKRAALEQYFAPIAQNPRFLDVISEETSDLSDRELSVTQHLKQGTPEPEVPPPPRPRKTRRVITNPAILVGTKIIDVPSVTHEICSGSALQSSSEAEVVYLEDSSNSTTPDPKSDNEDEKDTNDDLVSSTSSVPDLKESEVVEETKQVKVTVKRNDVLVTASDSVEKKCDTSVSKRETDRIEVRSEISAELTPPPTPDDVSPKNEIAQMQIVEDRQVEDVESSKSPSDVNKAIEGRIEVLRFEEKDLKCSKLEQSEATQEVSQTNKKESFFADRNKSTSKASEGVKVDSSRNVLLSDVAPIEGGTDIEGKDSLLKADKTVEVKSVPEVSEVENIEWTVSALTPKDTVDVKIEDKESPCSKLELDEPPESISSSDLNDSKGVRVSSSTNKNVVVLPLEDINIEDEDELEVDEASKSVSISEVNNSKELIASNIDKNATVLSPKSRKIEDKEDLVCSKLELDESSKSVVNKPNEREVSWSKGERQYDNSHMETSSANFILDQDKNATSKHFTESMFKESYKCETQKEIINKRSVDVMSRNEKAADSKLSSRNPSVHVEEISKEMKDLDEKLSSKPVQPVHTTLDEATHSKLSPRVHVVEIRKEMEDSDEKSFSKPIHTTSDKGTDSKLSPKVHIVEIRKEMEDLDKKSVSEPIHTTSDKAADSKLSPKVHIVKIRKEIEDSEEKSLSEPIHTISDKAADSKLSPKVHIVEIQKEMEDSDKKSFSEPIHTTSDKAADSKLSPRVHIVEICKEVEDSDEKSFSKPVHTTLDKAANGKLSSRTSSVHIVESRKEVKDSNEISVSKPVHVILDKTADSKLSPRILKEEIRKEMNDLTGKLFSKPVLTTLDKAADSKLSSKTPSVRIVEIRKEMEDTKEKLFSKPVHATTDNAAESKLSPKVHIVKIRKEIEDSEEKSFSTPIHTTLDKSADPKLSPKVHIVETRKEKEDSDEKLFSKPVHTTVDEAADSKLSPKVHIVEIRKEVEDSTEKLFTTPAHTALDKAADSKFSPKVHIMEIRKEVEDSNEKLFSKPTHTSLDKAADSKLSPKVHIVEIRKEVEDSKEKLFSKPIHTTVDEAADSKLSPKVHMVEIRKEVESSNGKLPSKPDYTTLDKAADSKLSPKKFSKSASELKKAKQIESPSKDLNKEIENICSSLRLPESIVYSNVVSPPAPSPSPSLSSGSSSRATSLCTAKYNPMSSSIADMDSINDNIDSPRSLRELCIHNLMSHPFGSDILQELADVSSSIEHLTNNLLAPANLPAFMRKPSNGNSARLHAKDLSEWLQLARNKSTSESDLTKDENRMGPGTQRRTSLPQEFYEHQMRYLEAKEREIQRELEMLEEEKQKLTTEMVPTRHFHLEDYHISRRGDFAESKKSRPLSMPAATEFFRRQMYDEYMGKIAAMEERKQQKVIKVTPVDASLEAKSSQGIQDEFMDKVKQKQKMGKLGRDESDEDRDLMDGNLPKHLKEFIDIAQQAAENSAGDGEKCCKEARRINRALSKNRPQNNDSLLHEIDSALVFAKGFLLCRGVWSPGQKQEFKLPEGERGELPIKDEPISPVWTPKSATSSPTVERKEFRPVKFESPVLSRKGYSKEEPFEDSKEPPWKVPERSSDTGVVLASTLQKRLPTSHSSPASGFNDLPTTRLPRAQNPTITLLQKAREGQLPKGAAYIEQEQSVKRAHNEKPPHVGPGEILYKIKNEYTSESDSERPRKMADLGPRQFEGIGPTTRDGMPLILRSEVKDANQSKWYKKMYDTIHKQKPHRDDYVTVRYKQRRAQYPYTSGYLSEPEPGAYDSDFADYKYATLDRRRLPARDKENEYSVPSTMPRSAPERVGASVIKHGHDPYKNQPGRIENYIPGHSSISEKEAKEWWDEVMDIFDGWLDDNSALPSYDYMFSRALAKSHLEQQKRVPQTKSFINQALKESGYESDSTLVFRRRDDTAQQLSPSEQKEAYKIIQKGGDIPLHGLRKPAPERPKEEPEMEFFPISPTLTRIRVHKNVKPQKEILCYPVTLHPHPSTVFAHYKRTAPSGAPKPPPMPPSPPRRRSSRNNSTLRLISTMKVKTEKLPVCRRHETCFSTTSSVDNTNVKYLRDKITCKLSPGRSKDGKETKPKMRVSKVVSASPEIRSKIVSTLTTSKDPKTSSSRIQSRTNLTVERTKSASPQMRTFGTEKKKVDLILPKIKRSTIASSPDLLSPTEVKKAVETQNRNLPVGTVFKKSTAVLASAKNSSGGVKDAVIPIKVGISEKGKAILKNSIQKPSSPGATVRLRNKSLSPVPSSSKVKTQKEAIQTDYFFQHLFLRDLPSPTPSMVSRTSWSSTSEPTISAMKVYLRHTRPVTDSKFRSLDLATSRSRSASPKSVTWETSPVQQVEKRSSSLPPKLVFSQTSRPVSPRVERRLIRSPSSRKIMQLKGQPVSEEKSESARPKNEISIYSCPSISHSTSSIDSCDRKDRFKDLNEFYSAIEKFGQLEQTTSSYNLKPRRRFEDEIIDYDRWREVRTRERAEKELKSLVIQLKEDAKEKGFLFCPKEVDAYRWRKELDRGLRIKEKSVDNIKEEFERLKEEESERESARRRELACLKDTYKPLWRGDSVLGLANKMVERRSQSEGRVAAARQKLIDSERMLTHGIGSRLWSSLSSEQVNILKNQLSEIYSQNVQKQKKEEEEPVLDYSIQVPKEKILYRPPLTVRRNSDTSEYIGSTDESTKTVIHVDKDDIKKKVEYFENVAEQEKYSPTIYKPSESHYDFGDLSPLSKSPTDTECSLKRRSITSQSYQDLKELFGEQELMKFATVPLPPISEATTNDSFYRSRSLSPYFDEPLALVKTGEVRRLKNKFEYPESPYPPKITLFKPRRCRSDSNLYKYAQISIPGQSSGDVDLLRSKYEYPAHAGRGRSRVRRGGVVSPTFLRAEDRFMPHINIISKIANLYSKKGTGEKRRSTEELAKILGCPVGEVEKLRQKFDAYGEKISLLGHMFTSSPNIKELRDIAPYLAASWIAHRYPRTEDNTRSLSSPDSSVTSRDTSALRRDRPRPKSTSPQPKKSSILKTHQRHHSADKKPSVSFKEPEPPVPPPKGHHGVRNLQQESPRKYVENEVTIHYKTPVRQEIKEYLSEDELAYRQAEAMKKIYQEERRRKYLQVSKSLQELQDMNNRRHTDNFIPSQKSPIPLNRYDDFEELSPPVKPRPRSPEPRLLARALYNFVGQTARELTFRKGDLIYVRRQVDKNWYEGELNAMVGLFPVNYVEIVTYDTAKTTPRKSHEGQARAKYNFVAQTHLELSLAKGELVVITRRVDDNWFEGKIGGRKGIFPVSYVDVLIDASDPPPPSSKPVAAPAAHSLLLNGSSGGKESMGSHSYTPSLSSNQLTTSYHAKPVQVTSGGSYGSLNRAKNPVSQALHIETQSEPIPYRAMFKYLPQNDDELELLEGDTVYVLEKCDDGWYVGSSDRTGAFGTFPGNYVEKI